MFKIGRRIIGKGLESGAPTMRLKGQLPDRSASFLKNFQQVHRGPSTTRNQFWSKQHIPLLLQVGRMFSTVPQFADIDVETLQAEVDWRRSDTMTEIDNQCGCRTCWAYSVLSSIESVRKIKTESELKDAVTRQPIVASLFVGEEFESYKAGDGIFEKEVVDYDSGDLHAVLVIGFGELNEEKFWIIRNSYGTNWGYGGYGLIRRDNGFCYGACEIAQYSFYPLWEVGKANDGLTSVDSGTVSEAAAVSGTVFSPSVVVPGFSKDADKIGEQQQHQNFPDESTSESTSSTWIGKNLIVEDDIKSPHVVDSPHSRLIERPPELIFRRGAIFPREPSASGLTIISDSVNAIAGSCEEKAISEDQLANWDKVNNESGNGQVLIKICPEAGVSAALPEAAYGCLSASALSKP
ncbi:unnamed protein product [Trifolium pratense]|uniref:Uncharacterized protein n=1 Tax=Trifolium pratense TaxID=57577 RepID=A0ACB0LQI3_TRIPR|nr:unnamed protein product [Trifolium pratense]